MDESLLYTLMIGELYINNRKMEDEIRNAKNELREANVQIVELNETVTGLNITVDQQLDEIVGLSAKLAKATKKGGNKK